MNNAERMKYIEKFTELQFVLEKYHKENDYSKNKDQEEDVNESIDKLKESIDFLAKGDELEEVDTIEMKRLVKIIEALLAK